MFPNEHRRTLRENPMRRRIAIIEDDPAIRANYSEALHKHGFEVLAYADRASASAALRARLPDLAIIDIGLGPDGPAGSNNDFDMLEEADLAAKLQKLIRNDPEALPAKQAFEMATIGGARALGLDKEIGSLETGKRADLITINLDVANAVPLFDPYSQVVYALKGGNVLDVVVNGKEVVRDHRAVTLDQAAILAKAREYGLSVAQSRKQKR